MPIDITKVDVWAGEMTDEPGGLASKLQAVAKAGADLEFLVARRSPDKPGKGVVFVAPVKGAAQTKAAAGVGLTKAAGMHSLRLEAADKPGFGAKVAQVVADAGINLRGLSAAALGRKCVVYFAFDSDADARKAATALKKALADK